MSIINRFFGKKETTQDDKELIANPEEKENIASLQVLFENDNFEFTNDELQTALRHYQPYLSNAKVELEPEFLSDGNPLGLIGWDNHVIKVIGFNQPFPRESLEACLQFSYYSDDLKQRALEHKSHIMLYYNGYDDNPLNQLASLALVAGFLSKFGAITTLNENGLTSLPSSVTYTEEENDLFDRLQQFPIPYLYCGTAKFVVEDIDGVWLRTNGASSLGLPDFATLIGEHAQAEDTIDLFHNLFMYLLNSDAYFTAEDTMQVGDDLFMRVNLPTKEQYYLESDNELFVLEFISEAEINQNPV